MAGFALLSTPGLLFYRLMQPSKDAYYFHHDSNARNDIKIIKLRRKLGMSGYGCYWCIIEILREQATYKMPVSAIDDIAFQLGEPVELINEVIKSFGLFQIDNNDFYSERLIRSMASYLETKEKFSKAGKAGAAKRWGSQETPSAPPLKRIS